jgi:hypothetical protein
MDKLPQPPVSPHYRAVSFWAVLSAACSLASLLMVVFGWVMAIFPLAAVYLGYRALRQIDRTPEEYTGVLLAKSAMASAAVVGLVVGTWLLLGGNEVPHGYRRLEYAELEPNPNEKGQFIPPLALELSEKKTKVYIRGYMLPPPRGRTSGLTKFSICNSSDQCKFGMNAARPTELIKVELTGDLTMNYVSSQIGVGGIFCADDKPLDGKPYLIKADYIYR